MTIETLHALPTHTKGEDGYYYDEKYVGGLYRFKDKLVYFNEKSIVEYPLVLLTELEELLKHSETKFEYQIKQLDDDIKNSVHTLDFSEEIQTINLSLDTLKGENNKTLELVETNQNVANSLIEKLAESLDNSNIEIARLSLLEETVNTKIKFINDKLDALARKIESLDTMTKVDIEKVIDEKLSDVYENFKNVSTQLTKSAVQEALKDSKRDQTGKLKMSSLAMLKELDYKPDDIKILSEAGLI